MSKPDTFFIHVKEYCYSCDGTGRIPTEDLATFLATSESIKDYTLRGQRYGGGNGVRVELLRLLLVAQSRIEKLRQPICMDSTFFLTCPDCNGVGSKMMPRELTTTLARELLVIEPSPETFPNAGEIEYPY